MAKGPFGGVPRPPEPEDSAPSRVAEKKTRFMFRYRLKVVWGPDEASHCVAWFKLVLEYRRIT